jgi:hypothetical protein
MQGIDVALSKFLEMCLSCLRKLFILIELNVHIFCDYMKDGFIMVLMDTKLRGFDRLCPGRIK